MAKAAAKDSERAEHKPLWKKPLVWMGGIVLAALGATLTTYFTGIFNSLVPDPPQTGDPVIVSGVSTYRSDTYGNSVAFPRGTHFDNTALVELNAPGTVDTDWLEERGGSALGSVFFQVVLTGNRADGARVLDADVSPDCGPPLDGLLFSSPPAGAEESIGLYFNMDSPDPRALSATDQTTPYFPTNTISLADGESQVLLVEASTDEQHCSFSLDLTVLDGDEQSVQAVTMPDGRPFQVTAFIEETRYEQVYLGGVLCSPWVKATEAYFEGDYEAYCGGG